MSDNDFKYLTEELHPKNFQLFKQKGAYPYEYMDSFEKVSEEKLSDKKYFHSSVRDGTTDDNGEKLNGHVSDKEYLTCIKIWNEFNIKDIGDYHDHQFKKLVVNVVKKVMLNMVKDNS